MRADPGVESNARRRKVTTWSSLETSQRILTGDPEPDYQVANSQTLHLEASALRYGPSSLRRRTDDQAVLRLDPTHIHLLPYRNWGRLWQFS